MKQPRLSLLLRRSPRAASSRQRAAHRQAEVLAVCSINFDASGFEYPTPWHCPFTTEARFYFSAERPRLIHQPNAFLFGGLMPQRTVVIIAAQGASPPEQQHPKQQCQLNLVAIAFLLLSFAVPSLQQTSCERARRAAFLPAPLHCYHNTGLCWRLLQALFRAEI